MSLKTKMSFWQQLLQFGQWEFFHCWWTEQQYYTEQETGNPPWSLSLRSWFLCWTVQKFNVKELPRALPRLLLENLNCIFWGPSRSSWSLLSLSKEKSQVAAMWVAVIFITIICTTIYIAIHIYIVKYIITQWVIYIITAIFSITQVLGKFLLKVLLLQWDLEEGWPHLPLRLRSLLQNLVQFFHGLFYKPVSSGKSWKGRCSSVLRTDFSSSCICICCVTGKWLKVNCYSRILCSFSFVNSGDRVGKENPLCSNLAANVSMAA